jgi:transposase
MTLHPQLVPPIPAATAQVAHAAFPKGNLYMRLRDTLGVFFTDNDFAALYPRCGHLAQSPWRLALITVMQYVESLSDRQAAEQVRARIDWKYALSLELTDSGFDHSVLSEFRDRLLKGHAEEQLLNLMLNRFQQAGLLKAGGHQRSDSTHVVAAVRAMNRIEFLGETVRYALNTLAEIAPTWLRSVALNEWYDRYSQRLEDNRLPKKAEERDALAAQIGFDGFYLWHQLESSRAPIEWRQLPAIEALRQIWLQQYYAPSETIRLRTAQDSPPGALRLRSPYDLEARRSRKNSLSWTGYKVHFSETCDEGMPRLITHVETSAATTQDQTATPVIHAALDDKGLLPKRHVVDQGYTSAQLLLSSQKDYEIELYGPVSEGSGWQAQTEGAFDLSCFQIAWSKQQVKCPKKKVSRSWKAGQDGYGNPVIHVQFSGRDCTPCKARSRCTKSKRAPRELTLKPFEAYQALQQARDRQATESVQQGFAIRAGVEGTISQAVRGFEVRQCRYIGFAKTHLQHVITAAAMNVVRVINWLDDVPLAQTRQAHFARLAPVKSG